MEERLKRLWRAGLLKVGRGLPTLFLFLGACGAPEPSEPRASNQGKPTGKWIAMVRSPHASAPQLARTLRLSLTETLAARIPPLELHTWRQAAAVHLRPEIVPGFRPDESIAIFDTNRIWMASSLGMKQERRDALFLSALRQTKDVAWAEPDYEYMLAFPRSTALDTPTSPLPTGPQFEPWMRIKLDKALAFVREKGIEPQPVTVAVLDTGVDSLHPDLKDQMFENPLEKTGLPNVDDDGNGYTDDLHGADVTFDPGKKDGGPDPDPGWADLGGPGHACPFAPAAEAGACGHGTHVAGIIAAKPRADALTQGVCESCRILSLRVTRRLVVDGYEYDGPISDAAQIRAMAYVLRLRDPNDPRRLLVNVVNMSLGKYFRSRTLAYLLEQLNDHNVLVVGAAGNDDTDTPSYPAAYDSVISVCALGNDGDEFHTPFHRGNYGKAAFSNFGDWVDICAPGTDILSTVPSDGEASARETKSGTSQATPFVAGSLGFLLSVARGGALTDANEALGYLLAGADAKSVYEAPFNKGFYEHKIGKSTVRQLGAGIVDLHNATLLSLGDAQGKRSSRPTEAPHVDGCVLNASGATWAGAMTSLPAVAAQLGLLWLLFRRTQTKAHCKKRNPS